MIEFSEKGEVLKNDKLGRYVVAARKVFAGEILLIDDPTLIMPICNETRCTNCFRLTENICRKCKVFPLCERCPTHSETDCNFFIERHEIDRSFLLKFNKNIYGAIKCLLLGENIKTKKEFEMFCSLESHQEKRRNSEVWLKYLKTVVEPIKASKVIPHLKQKHIINEELIQHICGVIDVNSFEIRAPDDGSMRAIYLKASLLAHSCVANTSIAINGNNLMKIFANCDIEKGEMLTYCYTNALLGTQERQRVLFIEKYFVCDCVRCEDPTELQSHMSSLLCSSCATGGVIVYSIKKRWMCQNCGLTMHDEHVDRIIQNSKKEIVLANGDIYKYEELIAKFSKIFHPNHYLIIDLKQNVAAILRSFLMNPMYNPGKLVLERKTKLCEDILAVLRIVQPGISRLKAIAIYEMFSSYTELNRLRFHENEINGSELLRILGKAEIMLREAIRMLLYEPVDTAEGQLTKNMLKELRDLQNDMIKLS